jgi:nicotinate-nucleotide adenylyltransferase
MLPAVRRGILGGTFDPPHLAHLVAGEAAYRHLGLDIVSFVPAGAPWQKADRAVSAATHRWAMTELAVAGVDYFEADDREVHREGWTYTIDTIESFGGEDLVLVLGADAAAGLLTWHRAEEVMARTELAVVPRPGADGARVAAALSNARTTWLDGPLLDVSGTSLRKMVREGASIRFLVPDPVWTYIADHQLYVAD